MTYLGVKTVRRAAALSVIATASILVAAAVPASAHKADQASAQNMAHQRNITPLTDWRMYMHGPAHHSDNYRDAAITPAKVAGLTQAWHFSKGSFLSSPTVAGGYVFLPHPPAHFHDDQAAPAKAVET